MRNIDSKSRPRTQFRFKIPCCSDSIVAFGRIADDFFNSIGQKRTFAVQKGMSALPPEADMCGAPAHVRYGPKADIATLFDHLVCAQQERLRDREADFFRGLEIEDELEFRGLLDRQIGWLSATRDPVDILGSLTVHFFDTWAVG